MTLTTLTSSTLTSSTPTSPILPLAAAQEPAAGVAGWAAGLVDTTSPPATERVATSSRTRWRG
ncbi:hypothetical protein ABT154_20665 [Streptomyces sp. NPDC001728]|uniref:hypothetical protein n=1 Tax=Streptomyces sp. NPDC001728 TaxID=3154396 RepID=UPI003323BE1D